MTDPEQREQESQESDETKFEEALDEEDREQHAAAERFAEDEPVERE